MINDAYKTYHESFKELFPEGTRVFLSRYWTNQEAEHFDVPYPGSVTETAIKAKGCINSYSSNGVWVTFEDRRAWHVPAFCLTFLTAIDNPIALNTPSGVALYHALIDREHKTVRVGCAEFTFDSVLELAQAIKRRDS